MVCNCEICNSLIESDDVAEYFKRYGETKISDKNNKAYPTSEALDFSRRHYILNKIKEYRFCRVSSIDAIRKQLSDSLKNAEIFKIIHPLPYITKWLSVLK